MRPSILHVIDRLSRGGAARVLLTTAYATAGLTGAQRIVSLERSEAGSATRAGELGLTLVEAPGPELLRREIESADIVQLHFWNTPAVYELLRSALPPHRLVVCSHVAGDGPPQVITRELAEQADVLVATSRYTAELATLADRARRDPEAVTTIVPAAELNRLDGLESRPHEGFNVGYIGTVGFAKMHPRFVAMSARANIPDARFVVCGSGNGWGALRRQAEELGEASRFRFLGYVEDVRLVLEQLDVFGYPLCPGNYSSAELALQEAMYAGIPPVVLVHGGAARLVSDGETGIVARDEDEYTRALEFLHAHPMERARLGRNAREHARATSSTEELGRRWLSVYEALAARPKRARSWPRETGPPGTSGARCFVDALGGAAPHFATSLLSEDVDELFEAERAIAASPPVLRDADGGLLHYRRHYPTDAHLRLWTGLVLAHQGRNALAAAEFTRARELGCNHWRVSSYLARAARELGSPALEQQALEAVPPVERTRTRLVWQGPAREVVPRG